MGFSDAIVAEISILIGKNEAPAAFRETAGSARDAEAQIVASNRAINASLDEMEGKIDGYAARMAGLYAGTETAARKAMSTQQEVEKSVSSRTGGGFFASIAQDAEQSQGRISDASKLMASDLATLETKGDSLGNSFSGFHERVTREMAGAEQEMRQRLSNITQLVSGFSFGSQTFHIPGFAPEDAASIRDTSNAYDGATRSIHGVGSAIRDEGTAVDASGPKLDQLRGLHRDLATSLDDERNAYQRLNEQRSSGVSDTAIQDEKDAASAAGERTQKIRDEIAALQDLDAAQGGQATESGSLAMNNQRVTDSYAALEGAQTKEVGLLRTLTGAQSDLNRVRGEGAGIGAAGAILPAGMLAELSSASSAIKSHATESASAYRDASHDAETAERDQISSMERVTAAHKAQIDRMLADNKLLSAESARISSAPSVATAARAATSRPATSFLGTLVEEAGASGLTDELKRLGLEQINLKTTWGEMWKSVQGGAYESRAKIEDLTGSMENLERIDKRIAELNVTRVKAGSDLAKAENDLNRLEGAAPDARILGILPGGRSSGVQQQILDAQALKSMSQAKLDSASGDMGYYQAARSQIQQNASIQQQADSYEQQRMDAADARRQQAEKDIADARAEGYKNAQKYEDDLLARAKTRLEGTKTLHSNLKTDLGIVGNNATALLTGNHLPSKAAETGMKLMWPAMYAGAGVAAIGAGIGAGAGYTVHKAMTYDDALTHLKAMAGMNDKQTETLSKLIMAWSQKYGTSPIDAAQGIYNVASIQGITPGQSQQILKQGMIASSASETPLPVVLDALSTIVAGLGIKSPKNIKKTADEFFQSVVASKAEYAQIAPTLSNILPYAAQLHVGMPDIGAGIAMLTNEGNSAPEASVLYSALLKEMSSPGPQSEKQARALLGSNWKSLYNNNWSKIGGVQGEVDRIHGALGNVGEMDVASVMKNNPGMTEKAAISIAQQSFNKNAAARLLFNGNEQAERAYLGFVSGPGGDIGTVSKSIAQAATTKDAKGRSVGAALAAQEKVRSDPSTQWTAMQSSLQRLEIEIGEKFMPVAKNFIRFLNQMISDVSGHENLFSALAKGVQKLGDVLGQAGNFLFGFTDKVKGADGVFQKHIGLVQQIGNAWKNNPIISSNLGAAFESVKKGVEDLLAPFGQLLGLTRSASGKDDLAHAMENAAAAVKKVADGFQFVASIVGPLIPSLAAMWGTAKILEMGQAVKNVGLELGKIAAPAASMVGNLAKVALGWLGIGAQADAAAVQASGAAIKIEGGLVSLQAEETSAALGMDGLKVATVEAGAAADATPFGAIFMAITAIVGVLVLAYEHWTGFRNAVNAALGILSQLPNVLGAIGNALGAFGNILGNLAGAGLAHYGAQFGKFFSDMGAAAHNALVAVEGIAGSIVSFLENNWTTILIGIFTGLPGLLIQHFVPNFGSLMKSGIGSVVKIATTAMNLIIPGFGTIFTNLWSSIGTWISGALGNLKSLGKQIGDALKDGFDSSLPDWMKSIGALNDRLTTAIGNALGLGGGPTSVSNSKGGIGPYNAGSTFGNFGGAPSSNIYERGSALMLNSLTHNQTNGTILDTDFPAKNQNIVLPGGKGQMYTLIGEGNQDGVGGYEVWQTANGGKIMFLHTSQNLGQNAGMVSRAGVSAPTLGLISSSSQNQHAPIGTRVSGGTVVGVSGAPTGSAAALRATGNNPNFYHLCVVTDASGRQSLQWLTQDQMDSQSGQSLPADTASLSPITRGAATYGPQLNYAANKTGISPKLLASIATQESSFNPLAKTYNSYENANDIGLMQFGPAEAKKVGGQYSYDPGQNLLTGAKYYEYLLHGPANGDEHTALMMYNGGPGIMQSSPAAIKAATGYADSIMKRAGGTTPDFGTQPKQNLGITTLPSTGGAKNSGAFKLPSGVVLTGAGPMKRYGPGQHATQHAQVLYAPTPALTPDQIWWQNNKVWVPGTTAGGHTMGHEGIARSAAGHWANRPSPMNAPLTGEEKTSFNMGAQGFSALNTIVKNSPQGFNYGEHKNPLTGFNNAMSDWKKTGESTIPDLTKELKSLPPNLQKQFLTGPNGISSLGKQWQDVGYKFNEGMKTENTRHQQAISKIYTETGYKTSQALEKYGIKESVAGSQETLKLQALARLPEKAISTVGKNGKVDWLQSRKDLINREVQLGLFNDKYTGKVDQTKVQHALKMAEAQAPSHGSSTTINGKKVYTVSAEQAQKDNRAFAIQQLMQRDHVSQVQATAMLGMQLGSISHGEKGKLDSENAKHEAAMVKLRAGATSSMEKLHAAIKTFGDNIGKQLDPAALMQSWQTRFTNQGQKPEDRLALDLWQHIKPTNAELDKMTKNYAENRNRLLELNRAQSQASYVMAKGAGDVQGMISAQQSLEQYHQGQAATDLALNGKLTDKGLKQLDLMNQNIETEEKWNRVQEEITEKGAALRDSFSTLSSSIAQDRTNASNDMFDNFLRTGQMNTSGVVAQDRRVQAGQIIQGYGDAQVGAAEGDFTAFGTYLQTLGSFINGKLMQSYEAGDNALGAYTSSLQQIRDATDQVKTSTDGMAAAEASVTGTLSDIGTAGNNLFSDFENDWGKAVVRGQGVVNQYTDDMVRAYQATVSVTHAQNLQDQVIGSSTGNFSQWNQGLQGAFTETTDKLSYFGMQVGRSGNTVLANQDGIVKLTNDAIAAADNLATLSDTVSALNTVTSTLRETLLTQFSRTGSFDPNTLAAYKTAGGAAGTANADQIYGSLSLDRGGDINQYASDLSDEIKFLTSKYQQAASQFGEDSPQAQQYKNALSQVSQEYDGLSVYLDHLANGTAIATDKQQEVTWALGQYNSQGLDPGLYYLNQFTAGIQTSDSTNKDAKKSTETAAQQVQDLGTNAAKTADTLTTVITNLGTFAQDLVSVFKDVPVVDVTGQTVNVNTGDKKSTSSSSATSSTTSSSKPLTSAQRQQYKTLVANGVSPDDALSMVTGSDGTKSPSATTTNPTTNPTTVNVGGLNQQQRYQYNNLIANDVSPEDAYKIVTQGSKQTNNAPPVTTNGSTINAQSATSKLVQVNTDPITKSANLATTQIGSGVQKAGQVIQTGIGSGASAVSMSIKNGAEVFTQNGKTVATVMLQSGQTVSQDLYLNGKQVSVSLTQSGGQVSYAINQTGTTVGTSLANTGTTVGTSLSNTGTTVGEFLTSAGAGAGTAITNGGISFAGGITGAVGQGVNALMSVGQSLAGLVSNAVGSINGAISSGLSKLQSLNAIAQSNSPGAQAGGGGANPFSGLLGIINAGSPGGGFQTAPGANPYGVPNAQGLYPGQIVQNPNANNQTYPLGNNPGYLGGGTTTTTTTTTTTNNPPTAGPLGGGGGTSPVTYTPPGASGGLAGDPYGGAGGGGGDGGAAPTMPTPPSNTAPSDTGSSSPASGSSISAADLAKLTQELTDASGLMEVAGKMTSTFKQADLTKFENSLTGLSQPAQNMLKAQQLGVETPAKLIGAADYWTRQANTFLQQQASSLAQQAATGIASGAQALQPPVNAFGQAVDIFGNIIANFGKGNGTTIGNSALPTGTTGTTGTGFSYGGSNLQLKSPAIQATYTKQLAYYQSQGWDLKDAEIMGLTDAMVPWFGDPANTGWQQGDPALDPRAAADSYARKMIQGQGTGATTAYTNNGNGYIVGYNINGAQSFGTPQGLDSNYNNYMSQLTGSGMFSTNPDGSPSGGLIDQNYASWVANGGPAMLGLSGTGNGGKIVPIGPGSFAIVPAGDTATAGAGGFYNITDAQGGAVDASGLTGYNWLGGVLGSPLAANGNVYGNSPGLSDITAWFGGNYNLMSPSSFNSTLNAGYGSQYGYTSNGAPGVGFGIGGTQLNQQNASNLQTIATNTTAIASTNQQMLDNDTQAELIDWMRQLYNLQKTSSVSRQVGPSTDFNTWIADFGIASVGLLANS